MHDETAGDRVRRAKRPPLRSVGEEPDPRFSFANERTFLAWIRTALALIAAGLAITALLPKFTIPFGRRVLGLPLIGLGGYIAFVSFGRWEENERAMRLRRPLPASVLPKILALGVAIGAILAGILAAAGNTVAGK